MSKIVDPADKNVRPKLSEQVFEHLRNMVVYGELSPGDLVPSERVLMERFNVGRPAVREALQAMQSKGLITINHGERTRVSSLSAKAALGQLDDIASLMLSRDPSNVVYLSHIRSILEIGIVRTAAENCTEKDASDLYKLVELQRDVMGDPDKFAKADVAFHARIAQISGNPLIHATMEMLFKWMYGFNSSLMFWPGQEEKTLKEHSEIVGFIKAQDKDRAEAAMRDHIYRPASSFNL